MTDDGTIKTTANGVTYQYSATDNKWKIISGTANTIRSSGTTFPADPVDTQLFYRSDLEALFYYSTTATAWIQVNGGGFGPEVETASITDNSTTKVPCSNLVHDGLATKVALSGDETIAGVKTFSSFPITPSSSPTTDYQVANKQYIDKANMIGSGNACWIPCIFQIAYPTADSAIQNYGGLGSVSGSSKYWAFKAPIPTNKGGLKLYIKGFRFANATADANNYVTKVDIFGSSANSNVNILNSDTTDWTTAASSATDYDGASVSAIDCSGYADVGIIIQTESNGNNNLIIGAVQLECYYA
jgi:hypothetical protein